MHLTSYITSPLFLEELKKRNLPYDGIFSDIPYEQSPLPVYGLANKPTNQDLLSYRTQTAKTMKHPLFILSQLSLSFLTPLLSTQQPITSINLYTGMGSFGKKLSPELKDLDTLWEDFPKYEPLDAVNFFSILEQPFAKYLRIPHQQFPENIFSTQEIGIIDKQLLTTIETLSLKTYGYTWENGTIITTGANFPMILQLGDLLTEQKKAMDIFVISKISHHFTAELRSSLHQTKKLIWISDIFPSDEFRNRIIQRIAQQGLKHLQLQFLSPLYENLTTVFDEFSAEQAAFDAKGLLWRIE